MKHHIKLLSRDIVFWICLGGIFLILNGYFIRTYIVNSRLVQSFGGVYQMDATDCQSIALEIVFPIFSLFLILSYSIFQKTGREGFYELNQLYAKRKNYCCQILILLFLDVLVTMNALLGEFWFYEHNCIPNMFYRINMIENGIVWYFLLLWVAVMIGYALSMLRSRRVVLCVTVGILLLLSPLMDGVAMQLSFKGIDIYPFMLWIQLMPFPSASVFGTTSYIGFPIVKEHYWLMLFWIVFFCFFHIFSLYSKGRQRNCLLGLNALFCLMAIVILTYVPAGVRMDVGNVYNGNQHAQFYYNMQRDARTIQEKTADFQVDAYQMEFSFTDRLQGKVTLHVADETNEEQYYFTLYHTYRVTKVCDQDGNALGFHQYEDYLDVEKSDGIESITISYQGSAPGCVSYKKGMLLASYFPYYPRPGYYMVYEGVRNHKSYDEYLPILEKDTCFYDITVNTAQQVYSNLPEMERNHFQGEADGVFLVAGFVEEFNYRGIRVLYPYDGMERTGEEWKKSIDLLLDFEEECAVSDGGKGVKTILTHEIFGGGRNFTFGSNWAELAVLSPDKVLQTDGEEVPDEAEFILYYRFYLENGYNARNSAFYSDYVPE